MGQNLTKQKQTAYIAELERFGYTIMAIDSTAARAKKAVLAEYYERYTEFNGIAPDLDPCDSYSGSYRTYWSVANDEIYVHEVEYGKVWWE